MAIALLFVALHKLWTTEFYIGKGIGKMLLSSLEKGAAEKGITNILAGISSLKTDSINFHQKNGFIECGRFKKGWEEEQPGIRYDMDVKNALATASRPTPESPAARFIRSVERLLSKRL